MGQDGVLATMQHWLPKPGELIAKKYRVLEVVGVGGMGVVLKAEHEQLGQLVALKLLSVGDDALAPEAGARFLREAKAAALLKNEHVVRIYDVGTLEGERPFMVMELLDGLDLSEVLRQEGQLPYALAVELLLQACSAIETAHHHGIVHRDLKPSNLFLTQRSDGSPWLKVLDFGISKTLGDRGPEFAGTLTSTRAVLGSPYYMSPEQVRDSKNVDERTDVWALGMILYELLTGASAFQANTFSGVCAAIVADKPRPIRDQRPEVPVELEAVILLCLEKEVARRMPSVPALIDALRPFSSRSQRSAEGDVRSLLSRRLDPASSLLATLANSGAQLAPQYSSTVPAPAASASVPTVAGDATKLSAVLPSAGSRQVDVVLVTPKVSRRRTGLLLGAVALGLAGVVAWAALGPERSRDTVAARDTTRAPVAPAPPRSFALSIESTPPGAQVVEGERSLGTTPLRIPLGTEPTPPRSFELRLAGYQAFRLEQGPATADVEVRVPLVALPPATIVSAPATASRKVAPPPARPKAPPPETASSSDIRLQR